MTSDLRFYVSLLPCPLPATYWCVLGIYDPSFQPQIYGADRDTLGSGEGQGAARGWPQSRGSAQIWKGLGQRVRLSVKAKVSIAASGAWKVNFCRRAVKKMKSSVLASCSPGQARLPGKGAEITPTESRASSNHLSGSSRMRCFAQAAGAFLPRKVRWQCSPTHPAETLPTSFLPSSERPGGGTQRKKTTFPQLAQEEEALFYHPATTN